MIETDVVIIGGGHNGLVCAAYLAEAGLKVTVLERRKIVGGAAVTEEFHPGFRNSVASYTVSLLNPKIIRDLSLHAHGLRIVERDIANFLPLPDGRFLKVGAGRTKAEVAKFSAKDAERLADYTARLDRVADVLRAVVLETPPNVAAEGWRILPELLRAAPLGRRLGGLDAETRRDFLDLLLKSAGDFLNSWFESDPIKAVFGFDGIVGTYQSPYAAGTAYVLLHHVFGETNGKRGVWGHAIGGMGAITQAMAKCCSARGVDIRTDAAVREVIVEGGHAVGVVTEKGEAVRAKIVVSNLNPKLLFTRLVDPAELPPDFLRRMQHWRSGSGSFRMNVALSELPDFSAAPGKAPAEHHSAGIIIGPSLAYMDRAFLDAKAHGWSKAPVVEMLIPSTLDDTLAPPGQARRKPLLPARRAGAAGRFSRRQLLGRSQGDGRRPDDRHGQFLRAEFFRLGDRAPGALAARSRARVRAPRRRHLPRGAFARPDLRKPPGNRPRGLSRADRGALHVRLRHASGRRRHRRAGAQRRARNSSRRKAQTVRGGLKRGSDCGIARRTAQPTTRM